MDGTTSPGGSAASGAGAAPLLELSGMTKAFGGVTVLKGVSFDVRAGEVHALLGENGAGKSTLIKIIVRRARPDAGDIRVDGAGGALRHAARAPSEAGIATVYQELLLFPELTVAENIFIGHAPRTAGAASTGRRCATGRAPLLDELDSHDLDVDARVGSLSVANRQRVEIAKALSQDARVLIMDEPTAALAEADVQRLISHRPAAARRAASASSMSATACRRSSRSPTASRCCATARWSAPSRSREVDERELVSMMVGRSIDQLFPKVEVPIGEPCSNVRNVSPRDDGAGHLASRCAPARSSASPASSAPAAPNWR